MSLNLYGDESTFLAQGHGADIASQRADDLDLLAIEQIKSMGSAFALDVACGAGGQALRMVVAGALTVATDALDMGDIIARQASQLEGNLSRRISFIQSDMREINKLPVSLADVIVCQRAIHYLKFDEAMQVVIHMKNLLRPGGRLYLSASGLNSELGEHYERVPLELRYANLSEEMRGKHDIQGNVCLYTEVDMAYLLNKAGLVVEKLFVSSFGNIKAVAHA